jgi:hypothetical protein
MPDIDLTAVALGAFCTVGTVAVALAPGDAQTKAIAMAALGPIGGAAGGMVMPHAGRRSRYGPEGNLGNPPSVNSPEFSD